jgi:predicted  nucleic acid-binding Zn-ribbon protein
VPIETEHMGSEEVPSDSYLGKPKYKITCKCLRCGHIYKRVVARLTDDNPPCPKKACKAVIAAEERAMMERNIRRIIEEERGPGHIGANVSVKAIDFTAEVVQKDYGLTNLKDNIREGEAMAPALPPVMQKAADNFFQGSVQNAEGKSRRAKQMDLIGRRAIAGAFRNMAVNPGAVVGGQTGQKAIRKVGDEKLR